MTRAVSVVLVALLLAQPPRDQPRTQTQPPGRGAIRGRVVAAATHDAIRNARVVATGEHDWPAVMTDAEGRFAIAGPAPGEFQVAAAKAGFAEAYATARAAGAPARLMAVAADQIIDDVTIELPRGAAISGVVIDQASEPIAGASVMVERAGGAAGKVPRVGLTDDLGQYRIGGLAEGHVLVSVFASPRDVVLQPNGGIAFIGPGNLGDRIYYPGGEKASQGEAIALQPGDDKRGVDFTVPSRLAVGPRVEPAARDRTVIGGRVLTVDGRPLPGAQVAIIPTTAIELSARFAITDRNGAYQFTLPQDASATVRIAVQRHGYLPAVYGQRGPSDPGEEVAVAAHESRTNLDVTLLRPAAVSGTLFDEYGDPVEGAIVGAFTLQTTGSQRRLATARNAARPTDDLGHYRIAGLPAGEYLLAAFVGQVIGIEASIAMPGFATTF